MRPEVWAPLPTVVELQVATSRHPMRPDPHRSGWWVSDRELEPGSRYGFVLDGEGPFPDPRSLSLPDGVHGLSRAVALTGQRPTRYGGTPLRGKVLYELHVGTFTDEGTLDAAAGRLADLLELGVEAVELMPLSAFAGVRGWGYDGVAPWSVHAPYGDQEALVRFVDAAHDHGLAVLLDVVHNHLGPEGNYLSKFGPYFTERHTTPWGPAVNLDDAGAAEVRRYLIGSARHFLVDIGMDGLRLDAVHALRDDSPRHFVAELSDEVAGWEAETGRPLTLFAESDLNRAEMVSPVGTSPGARGMDGQWADDIHHALHSFFGRETQGYYVDYGTPEILVKALTRVFVRDGGISAFRGTPWGAPVDPTSPHYDGHSFVASLQNHDQVGNRAVGDRFHMHAGHAAQSAAAALYLLGPFTPMLFMGEEWAASSPFPYFSQLGPELGPLVTEGRAREFAAMGWQQQTPDPQAEETFLSAKLHWEERSEGNHAEMLEWYRTLLRLRREHPEFRSPDLAAVGAEVLDADTVALHRGPFTILASRVPDRVRAPRGEVLASTGGCIVVRRG
ncbi:malto-oligosyltrehalose trehalohydrolase [Tessaracoccus sp. MC1865]|uniref:malto-oligosyltrehalose trehalohydrolase n=1 Tax=Tessaracoccus sp. MC1865 TaxID=2760310 RepID=UPI0016013D23|nr:malto-oligosyltrehalose trehalohydrolase [Tessaracoccus sp. MC1865]MBB1483436.1 malto-oligosyltrehalose trehalohydrolase [Tessaracoccus sp. MC1865]QTO36538.1 malto-oligosyltrehalose trehalohydrolase [Tessaracoccus sp. MC1865]